MPTHLEELVEFLHHGNTQIRQVAVDALVPLSLSQPEIFKVNQLEPIKDLKLLVKDYEPIRKNVITMLINLSGEQDVAERLAEDDTFLELLLSGITHPQAQYVDEMCMLLANMSKSDTIKRLVTFKRGIPKDLSTSENALDQLMDCFVREPGTYNKGASYDYLAYVFADLARFREGSDYMTTIQPYDSLHPLSKLLPFTSINSSLPRRLGVASIVKNVAFDTSRHGELLNAPLSILPFILVPLASGKDNYADHEQESMIDELQLLDEDVRRDSDKNVIKTHLESLLLLTSTRMGREFMREKGVYYTVRELHLAIGDDEVEEACDRVVQMLMRDEAPELEGVDRKLLGGPTSMDGVAAPDDDDDKIVEIL